MQQGGSPYGALPSQPQMQQSSELPSSFQGMAMAEAAPPITSLPPPPPPPSSSVPTFEELATGDDPLEGGSGGSGGNRWPRQETLALLKIRSDMDAAFKDATLKGPLWEDVSRKLAELGYKRNAKKCKEKFENVHKYYKRTKEGRAGRQDGKSYRFFSQLEALHSSTVSSPRPVTINLNPPPMTTTNTSPNIPRPIQTQNPATSVPMPITSVPPPPVQLSSVPSPNMFSHNVQYPPTAKPGGFSSNSSSSSSGSESDDEQTEDLPMSGKKRKREGESGSKKMMAFFEGLMRQVMERQETMQKKFLEAIEKREQDRMIREEAWRRQEITRMAREHELAAQERAAAASRDAAIISFLQKVTGQTVQVPSTNASTMPSTVTVTTQQPPPSQTPPPPQPPPSQVHQQTPPLQPQQPPPPQQTPPPPQQLQQQQQQQQRSQDIVLHQYQTTPPANTEMMAMQVMEEGSGGMTATSTDPTSSRWPKAEVHALIQLRSGLDSRYQETGPKGPLWEEISAGMRRLGYNRNAKRCKEKWENINKYFKKVKESNKQRPEDAKTCPYFHQLDALYRSKHNTTGSGGGSGLLQLTHQNPNPNQNQNPNPNPNPSPISMMVPPQLAGDKDQTNGGARTNFFGQTTTGGGDEGGIMKKPEDIVRELMEQTNNNNEYGNDPESDNMDEDDDDDEDGEDDEEEEGNGQYRIQFQRQNNVSNSNNNGGGNGTPQNTSGNSTGSFLAMVR